MSRSGPEAVSIGQVHPGRNVFGRPSVDWGKILGGMRPGEYFTISPTNRKWVNVRNMVYQHAGKLGRQGEFKMGPKKGDMIEVHCVDAERWRENVWKARQRAHKTHREEAIIAKMLS